MYSKVRGDCSYHWNGKKQRKMGKSKFIILTKGKDRIFRGVTLLHKRQTIKRPLQVECPLERESKRRGNECHFEDKDND